MADGQEFFYLDDDGTKQDAELHNAIINPVDFPIDEKIMGPIRARHRAKHVAGQQAKTRGARWLSVKARAEASIARGHNDLYRGWNEQDHPRHPAGSPQGGQFVGDGGGSEGSGKPASGGPGAGAGGDEQPSRTFSRESPSDAQRSRDVAAIWRSDSATFYELTGTGGAKTFHNAITRAKTGEFGASVHVYEAAEYEGMRLFTAPDGMSGFALKGDDIVSLFKYPGNMTKGVAGASLKLATEQGGRRLDAFDTALPSLYARSGFEPVARLKWNEDYAPPGWDKATYKEFNGGEPDVVFMVYRSDERRTYAAGAGPYVAEYDDGTAAQRRSLATKPSPSPHAKDPTSASSLLRIETDVTPESLMAKYPGADQQVADAREKLKGAVPTNALVSEGGHRLPDGSWTPARQAAHRQIVDELMSEAKIAAAVPKAGAQPVLHILGGRGGSGKSWFTSKDGTFDASTSLYVNSDDVKERLPGYGGWNAGLLHEESSYVGDVIETRARDLGLNVIIDATLKSGTTTAKRISAFKAAGYRIDGHYMYASPATAADRALGRFVRGNAKNGKGRFVPPEYSLSSLSNEHSFDEGRKDMDFWEVYDNSSKPPRLHSRS
jgi:predicted ABC-type ATPase